MKKILVIHGPNLNMLGQREPGVYGNVSLTDINEKLRAMAVQLDVELKIVQSNHEGEIVDAIQQSANWAECIIINPAAYTHTSVAIRDALTSFPVPVIEVHLSNIYKREDFRQKSFVSQVAQGTITGFGADSYYLALEAAVKISK